MIPANTGHRADLFRKIFYLTAGGWGALLGIISASLLNALLGYHYLICFVLGLTLNAVFNLWFSVMFLYLRDVPVGLNRTVYSSYLFIHLFLTAVGITALAIGIHVFARSFFESCVVAFAATSVLSLLMGRIWVFVSPSRAYEEYEELDDDFYIDSGDSEKVGSFRAWYHRGRWDETLRLFNSVYKPGDVAYDFGSGGSEWNTAQLPLIGVDVNEKLLNRGKSLGRLTSYVVAPLYSTGLPDSSADIIVITEVLEHMDKPNAVLSEIRRILRPSGSLILSVPNDWVLSPFFWLFNIQCFYRGYILGEDYYRERCGHVNHFTPWAIRDLLTRVGFSVKVTRVFRQLITFTVSTPAS